MNLTHPFKFHRYEFNLYEFNQYEFNHFEFNPQNNKFRHIIQIVLITNASL